MSTVPVLFRGLVDDAALFPPGNAPMDRAVAEHRHHKASPYADLVGRFLCPASRVEELRAVLGDGPVLEIGLIADTGVAGLPAALQIVVADDRLRLTAMECVAPPSGDAARSVQETAERMVDITHASSDWVRCPLLFVEVPRTSAWFPALPALHDLAVHAKLRTGGARPDAFPSDRELATFIVACAAHETFFKLTAGLHHAVRHTDPATGCEHHGFLNVLAAVVAERGDDRLAVAELIAERKRAPLVEIVTPALAGARGEFAAFGSCSIAEPLADLVALGLLDRALLDHPPGHREEDA